MTLAVEPFTKYTTHICNEANQLRRLLRTVNSPRLMGLADTDVIATTAVDTFSTFLDVIGPENLGHVHFVDGNPGGHLVPGDGVLDLDGALEKAQGNPLYRCAGSGSAGPPLCLCPRSCDEAGDGLVQGKNINARKPEEAYFMRCKLPRGKNNSYGHRRTASCYSAKSRTAISCVRCARDGILQPDGVGRGTKYKSVK